ncbi:ADP-ribosylation factor-like protein 13B isoform X2 [Dreissena polymorpha]|uniref:ADP-ribosylation factor-like protein 13B n=1 Tax=Dreissena polymorpha TaxID=45954 RepID=A0A9D4HSK9_DREPO|nr:ADP-ribosylation factor-like protein 13B isoform X2 [Dreissena polymorpha]KAH3729475.1 hypothetical protein DPMN_055446 [Dreissena polymorpha]
MGNCVSCVKKRKEPKRKVTLAVLGLDSAGKTTTAKALLGESLETAPTVGFNKEQITFANYEMTLYDLGGGRRIRDIWKDYLSEIYGVIYVVDSASPDRFPEVKESLENLLSNEKVAGKPLLVLSNKEDLVEHVDECEIMEKLNLEALVNTNKCVCKMEMCSAIQGSGRKMDPRIKVGMKWLCAILDQMYDKLDMRVKADMEVMDAKRQREKEERRERVRIQREERAKQEEEERQRLGIVKVEEVEEDDIVTAGDPFRRLDSEEIKRKEEEYKANKAKEKERQRKLKELEQMENENKTTRNFNNNINKTSKDVGEKHGDTQIIENDDSELRPPRSSRSLLSLGWLGDGSNNTKTSNGQNRQMLPPLESPKSAALAEKKRNKKLKNKVGANIINQDQDSSTYATNGNFVASASTIQVVSVNGDNDDDSDNLVKISGRPDPFRNSKGLYKQEDKSPRDSESSVKKNRRKQKADNDDDFDTLRLSQHFDGSHGDRFRNISPSFKPQLVNGVVDEERSETPVRKLKKKKKHLRKNKLAPSDDEYELSDVQTTPKKHSIDWSGTNSPIGVNGVSHTNWGLAEDLSGDEIAPVNRSRPNFDSEEEPDL